MSTLTFTPAAQLRRPAVPTSIRTRVERPPQPSVHLTRRGRRAVALLTLGLVLAVSSGIARPWQWIDTGRVSTGAQVRIVTVAPGDNLWAVAKRAAPGRDPRDTVADIMRLNGLRDSSISAGQQIAVPIR